MNPLCHIPWTWLEIDFSKKQIRSCCKTDWIDDPTVNLFQHQEIKQRRIDFLNGVKPASCYPCWKLEDCNQISYRQFTKTNPYLQTSNLDINLNVPKTLSINFGNICNLACTYCNQDWSSTWAAEKKIPVKHDTDLGYREKIYAWLRNVVSNNILEHIILIGGEPTINPIFYDFLELLKENVNKRTKEIKITIQTNGMFEDRHIRKIIESSNLKFCNFTYRFSIDAIGVRAEFIRTGLEWEKFKNNFETLMKNRVKVAVHPTISVYSIGGLAEFLSWVSQYNYSWEDLGRNYVEVPLETSLRSLGKLGRELIPSLPVYQDTKIQEFSSRTVAFINSFDNEPDLKIIEQGLKYHALRSNILLDDAVPELLMLLNKYKN